MEENNEEIEVMEAGNTEVATKKSSSGKEILVFGVGLFIGYVASKVCKGIKNLSRRKKSEEPEVVEAEVADESAK